MPADHFLDTSVILYAYDLDAPAKRAVARAIVEEAWLQPWAHSPECAGAARISCQLCSKRSPCY